MSVQLFCSFNENDATNVYDYSTHGRDASTITGFAVASSNIGTAGVFNGSTTDLDFGNILDFSGTASMAIFTRLKVTAGLAHIICIKSGQYELSINSSNKVLFQTKTSSGTVTVTGTINIVNETLTTIGAVYDGANMFIYIDAVADNSGAQTGNLSASSNNFHIGTNATTFMTGSVEMLAVYSQNISADTITAFNNRPGGMLNTVPDSSVFGNGDLLEITKKGSTAAAQAVITGDLGSNQLLLLPILNDIPQGLDVIMRKGNIYDTARQCIMQTTLSGSSPVTKFYSGVSSFTLPTAAIQIDCDGFRSTVDAVIETKLDIGKPGTGGGLDVGEGGSYQTDGFGGATIVEAFTYDASATSGSRFTSLDINAQNTLLGAVGDRIYIGSTYKFWGVRFQVGVAKVGGTQILAYSKGAAMSALTSAGGMVVRKDTADTIGDVWLGQTLEKEYITYDKDIDSTWVALDNVLDDVPNTGTALFWMSFEVPASVWTTPPRIDEIKVRGSDFDVITGAAFGVYWGRSRIEKHERIDLGEGTGPVKATLNITSTQDFNVKKMRSANADPISRLYQLAPGTDTSCGVAFTIDYSASAAISTANISLDVKKLKNNTTIGSGETSDLTETTNIEVAAGSKVYTDQAMNTTLLDISDLQEGDSLSIELARTDSSGSDFYPLTLSIHYVSWTDGEHV